MDLRPIIQKKSHRRELTAHEIRDFVSGVVSGATPDYQITAFLSAVAIHGLNFSETVALTREMSGHGVSIPKSGSAKRVGKHSTGGVGDKTTFLVGPLVASYGVEVPFMAGRGLGHTGGTIDKLSGIPGLKTNLAPGAVASALKRSGFCFFEQTALLAPADRRLYALRDASGTVGSIPLIVSSILSKKIVESLDGLVLNVKYGVGSLMGPLPKARELARMLLKVARHLKLRTTVVLSAMEQPLGQMVGNNLEILECLETLRGNGPQDLCEVTVALAREMLNQVLPLKARPAKQELLNKLSGGSLVENFFGGLRIQGGRLEHRDNLKLASNVLSLRAPRSGYVQGLHARQIGEASMKLGAGRDRPGDPIDPTVGICLIKRVGDRVWKGAAFAEIFYRKKNRLAEVRRKVLEAYQIGTARKKPPRLIGGILKNF